jgi:putative cardiolipin synthase
MRCTGIFVALATLAFGRAAVADPRDAIDDAIRAHPDLTGSLVLEHGGQALLARAWLVDHARRSVDVQYFIWSTDNIGILASEALLRAAERGVAVRVIVDDLLIDASDETLLALAAHPNVDIRIYNPMHSVGVPWYRRVWGAVTDFRGSNQRMHDKVLIVDGELAITGGRNMADEYFDYDHEYNFRDRDALVLGAVVPSMRASFERFWVSALAVPVEDLLGGDEGAAEREARAEKVYAELAAYAADGAKFAPEVRAAIAAIPDDFSRLASSLAWGRVEFVSDVPGKNSGAHGLKGGGLSSAALGALAQSAQSELLIQSPYLVVSEPAFELLRKLRARRAHPHQHELAEVDRQLEGLQRLSRSARGAAGGRYRGVRVSARPRHPKRDHGPLRRAARRGAGVCRARQDSRRRSQRRVRWHVQFRSALREPQHGGRRRHSRWRTGCGRGRSDCDGHASAE